MVWLDRQCALSFKYRRRTRSVQSAVEEVYLRDDVACGSQLCLACSSKLQPLSATSLVYVIPDASALKGRLELFELPDLTNYILTSSTLKEVVRHGTVRYKSGLQNLYRDLRRCCHVFDDLHCVEVAPIRHLGDDEPPVLRVAQYYWHHLDGRQPIVVVSDDLAGSQAAMHACDRLARYQQSGVGAVPPLRVLSMAQYVTTFHGDNPVVMDLHESLSQALEAEQTAMEGRVERSGGSTTGYRPHLPAHEVEEGLAEGTLLQGVLEVNERRPQEAVVKLGGGGPGTRSILLPGRLQRNRAVHGDVVAVRALPQSQWQPVPAIAVSALTLGGEGAAASGEAEEQGGDLDTDAELLAAEVEADAEQGGEVLPAGGSPDLPRELLEVEGLQPTGEVMAILQRSSREVVACLAAEDDKRMAGQQTNRTETLQCVPLDRRLPLMVLRTRRGPQLCGQRFVVRIDSWELSSRHPRAHVLRVLGPLQDLRAETDAVLVQCGIHWQPFSEGALAELPDLPGGPSTWQPPPEERAARRDLTGPDYYVCSIDPPGCTDVDDALHVRRLPGGSGGWEVGVHIADVGWFVKQGGWLDREAADRCTTVYLVDRRLDMLPALLSEQLCSLRQQQERFAVSAIWQLDERLAVRDIWFGRTIIRSRHQLTYQQAQDVLDGRAVSSQDVPAEEVPQLRESLQLLLRLTDQLRAGRLAAGALELTSAELRFRVGADGKPQEVAAKAKLPMMDIVAEMMILANSAVAERIATTFPNAALLRNHPPPRPEALEQVRELFEAAGVHLDPQSPDSLGAALAAVSSSGLDPEATVLIKSLTTRALAEAKYYSTGAVAPGGGGMRHYGLALQYYTHFTSPIRRYADVIVHRQLVAALASSPAPPLPHAELGPAASTMNRRHRDAKAAQKQCTELYLLLLLHVHPHPERAIVYSITRTGLVVFVPKYHLKGTVHLIDRSGLVRPPLDSGTDHADDAFARGARRGLQLEVAGDQASIRKAASGLVLHEFVRWQEVWVLLAADGSRAHGPQLQMRLLAPSHPMVAEALASATLQAEQVEAAGSCTLRATVLPAVADQAASPAILPEAHAVPRPSRSETPSSSAAIKASHQATGTSASRKVRQDPPLAATGGGHAQQAAVGVAERLNTAQAAVAEAAGEQGACWAALQLAMLPQPVAWDDGEPGKQGAHAVLWRLQARAARLLAHLTDMSPQSHARKKLQSKYEQLVALTEKLRQEAAVILGDGGCKGLVAPASAMLHISKITSEG